MTTSGAPGSTYRVQLSSAFGFADLAGQVDYLAALGVSAAYLSPVLQAVPGSTHGYDVIDHSLLSADLGGTEAYAPLLAALRSHGLGVVADVVPNHMAVPTPERLNAALWSVLREGRGSPYARWFDIAWDAGGVDVAWDAGGVDVAWDAGGVLVVPTLGSHLAEVLEAGELTLDRSGEEPVLRYYDHELPVRDGTADLELPELLARQHYRLAWWRTGDEALNYRRFFDVATLIGLRVEDEEVFGATHALLLAMVRDGQLDGLRIDHPDGLADPRGYLRRLREATGGAWVVVEKILEAGEELPCDWPCAGTTGYDALTRVGGVLLDPRGAAPLAALHAELTGGPAGFEPVAEEAKRWVLEHALHAEVARLVDVLVRVCEADVLLRDHTRRALREVLVELLVAFPVYRAYVVPGEEAPPESIDIVASAAALARERLPGSRRPTLDLLVDLVLGRRGRGPDRDEVVVRFQQTCGPVMAKGMEDTAFYRWPRLTSLNEVGGDPERFGASPGELHAWCGARTQRWPEAMTALSTHDTKRSEDVRARLALLSELPEEWAGEVRAWRALAAHHRDPLVDDATDYLLWQTLLGAWPLEAGRLVAYLEKATREAKRHTSWTEPDPAYEEAVAAYARAVAGDPAVRERVGGFAGRLAPAFEANVLSQKLLALTVPGVPDVYQGTELVALHLVDPDNRRPVDWAARRALLEALDAGAPARGLDARKLLVTSRALRARRALPEAFAGAYAPLETGSEHAVAFCRGGRAVTVATRLPVGLERSGGWGDTVVTLPGGAWTDVLTGADHLGGPVPLGQLLATLPVALLTSGRAA